MKTKNRLWTLSAVAMLVLMALVVSCSDKKDDPVSVVNYVGTWEGTTAQDSTITITIGNVSNAAWLTGYNYSIRVIDGGTSWTSTGNMSVSTGIVKVSNSSFHTTLPFEEEGAYLEGTFTSKTEMTGNIHVLNALTNQWMDMSYTASLK